MVSEAPFVDPGSARIKVSPRSPAIPRDSIEYGVLSRGASSTVLLERDRQALRIIQRNLEEPGFEPDRWVVLPGDALTSLARLRREERTFDIIYLDPPYASTLGAEALEEAARLLDPEGVAVLEHDVRSAPPESARGELTETRRFGDTAITLYGPGGPRP